ncbi:MAG: CPBP family intramembrane glutamic endopeptidase, partial [Pyrinomonadaceae bacterium]
QYYNNPGVIAAVGTLGFALTYVRARTGSVLPCFIIHLVFNSIQVAVLIYEYFHPTMDPAGTETKAGLLLPPFAHAIDFIF